MLRQALHDAEDRKLKESLLVVDPSRYYGSTNTTTHNEHAAQHDTVPNEQDNIVAEDDMDEEYGGDDNDDEEEDDLEEDDDDIEDEEEEDEEDEDRLIHWYSRFWVAVKDVIRIVANVDNLWDEANNIESGTIPPSSSSSPPSSSTKCTRNMIVLFWFVVLASSYATERSTFKLLVDRAGPFRLFAAEMVTLSHAFLIGSGILIARFVKRSTSRSTNTIRTGNNHLRNSSSSSSADRDIGLGISLVDIVIMAFLETLQLLLVFLTGRHVPPTLTVILIQFTLPLTAFLTQFVHPQGRCRCCTRECTTTTTTMATESNMNTTECESTMHHHPNTGNPNPTTTGSRVAQDAVGVGRQLRSPPPPPPAPPPPSYYNDPPPRDHYITTEHNNDTQSLLLIPNVSNHQGQGESAHSEDAVLKQCGGLSRPHVWGSLLIFLAVVLALVPAFYAIAYPDFFVYADTIPIRTAYNTLLYVSSCIPAAAAQLFKEHVFLQYKQPVNADYINALLSIFEFVFCCIFVPLIFPLQGLGAAQDDKWASLYPSSMFGDNMIDGLKCFFWFLSDHDQADKYLDDARCDFALALTLAHAFCIVSVSVAVDKIVHAGATKVMYRGMSAGIVMAVLCMHTYDLHLVEFSYGPMVDSLNLACLIMLILGSEVYHRVALKDLTFDTVYPDIQIESYYENNS